MATKWIPDEQKIAEARKHGAIIGSVIPRSLMKEVEIPPLESRVTGTSSQHDFIAGKLAAWRQEQQN